MYLHKPWLEKNTSMDSGVPLKTPTESDQVTTIFIHGTGDKIRLEISSALPLM